MVRLDGMGPVCQTRALLGTSVSACETDGTPAVLKLIVPSAGADTRNEITVLRLTNGEGLGMRRGRASVDGGT